MKPFSQWTQLDVERHNAKTGSRLPVSAAPTAGAAREADIQDEIEGWLKNNCHRAWYDRKRMDKPTTSRVGVPDFVGVIDGKAFGLEVKRPGAKATTEQLGELAWMRKAGAKTAVVYSLDEAIHFFKTI